MRLLLCARHVSFVRSSWEISPVVAGVLAAW